MNVELYSRRESKWLLYVICVQVFLLVIGCGDAFQQTNKQTTGSGKGNWEKGKDYTVLKRFRIEDKSGFGEPMVAYSILLPDDWKMNGGINWIANGLCVNELIVNRVSARSADGAFELELFPVKSWNWFEDPILLQSNQQQAASGFKACDIMQPYNAEAYLRYVFAQEVNARQIQAVEDYREVAIPMEQSAYANKVAMQQAGINTIDYRPSAIRAKVVFGDGKEGLAVVAVNQTVNQMPDFMRGGTTNSYVCSADQKLILRYPKGKEDEAIRMLSMILSSIRINPVWQGAVGKIMANIARGQQIENAKRAAIWRETQAEIGEIQRKTWEYKQQSNDRIAEERGRGLRGVEQWSDPGSGDKIDLTLGYNEAWSKGDGTYIMSNNPLFDPNVALHENWKKLEKK